MRLLRDFVPRNDAVCPSLRGVPTTKQSRIWGHVITAPPPIPCNDFFQRHCERSEAISYAKFESATGYRPRDDVCGHCEEW